MRKTLLAVLSALIAFLLGCHPPLETKEKHYVHPGEEAVLTGPSAQSKVFIALAKENTTAVERAVVHNDKSVLEDMLKGGKILEIENGTPVKVTAESSNERQVEIKDGPQRGRTGWVPFEWVRPRGAQQI